MEKNNEHVRYHIMDSTSLKNITLKQLLSHSLTKHELTVYFSDKLLRYSSRTENMFQVIVAYSNKCKSHFSDVTHLKSTHEEADTKIILLAVDATNRGITNIHVYCQDTDGFSVISS